MEYFPSRTTLPSYSKLISPSSELIGYVQDPNGKRTLSLLICYVLTLILYVWSALHLNVPWQSHTARQWYSAKLLQKLVADTLNNAFFACTGGFAFEFEGLDAVDTVDKDQGKRQAQRITLTIREVTLLAQCGKLLKVDRENIEDKSKVNGLAKVTVIFRLATKLLVTLLEVNTVAHNKPLLPNQPIIIRDKGLFSKVPKLETIYFRTTASSPTSENNKPLTSSFELSPLTSESGTAFFERRPRVVDKRPTNDFVSADDQNRWSLIKTAFAGYPFLNEDRLALAHDIGDAHCLHLKPEQLVADHIKNWPSNDLLRNVDGLIVGMVLWLANFCYGGIHAAAWNDHFPSVPEKWLWRASASYIGFCGGLWERWMDGEKSWWQNFGIGVLVFICGFSLLLARFYSVLEAFLSIREMPVSSYQTL
ncbi:hypothetical protein B0H67DRAFT_603172 [Lasiosphaeris hirsuta]|uniref:Uncharacterized protein n=1 Tax=Lasiosphaeris hirsuta TaxID=260670 RepID=A0AA40A2Y7_9PEZI|nr:hypothetical protein B0H67DRAFT_603172 [Lasiosphaeris hirsuta]